MARRPTGSPKRKLLAGYLQSFFVDRLVEQVGASPHTVSSYRDTFRLLLQYVHERTGVAPTDMDIRDIDAEMVGNFLKFYENELNNSTRSRNARLSAIRSFFRYVSFRREPELLDHCQRILSISSKRYDQLELTYLDDEEIDALLAAPDCGSRIGRRDRTIMLLMIQTGLRVSEVVGLRLHDISVGVGAHVRCVGKGRKERQTPLRPDSRDAIQDWIAERGGESCEPLFCTTRGKPLSRDAIEKLVRRHADKAAQHCATLAGKNVTPHVLRHTAAMQLRENDVDITVISLWLGHESIETTKKYLHASRKLKERAMARTRMVEGPDERYRPPDRLLGFLKSL